MKGNAYIKLHKNFKTMDQVVKFEEQNVIGSPRAMSVKILIMLLIW